jgi:hypothetical protein
MTLGQKTPKTVPWPGRFSSISLFLFLKQLSSFHVGLKEEETIMHGASSSNTEVLLYSRRGWALRETTAFTVLTKPTS